MSLSTLMARVATTSSSAGRLVGLLESELGKPLLTLPTMVDDYARSLLKFGATKTEDVVLESNSEVVVRNSGSVSVTTYVKLGASVLDISGPLINRDVSGGPCSSSPVSYNSIRAEITNAVADPRIKTVIARIDSGGGVASQMVDLADFITKTIANNPDMRFIASIDDCAASAAFGIAAAFPERYISRTGIAGSVGVVVRHREVSAALAANGIKDTYIFAGDNKVLGNGSEPLSAEALEMITKRVGMHYDLFVKSIATSTGMTVQAIKDTQAAIYQGQEAVDIGFATGIMTFTEIIEQLEIDSMKTKEQLAEEAKLSAALAQQNTATPETTAAETEAQATAAADAKVAEDLAAEAKAAEKLAAEEKAAEDLKLSVEREAAIRAVCSVGGVSAVNTDAMVASTLDLASITTLVANSTASGVDLSSQSSGNTQETTAEQEAEAIAQSWKEVLG